MRIFIRFHFDCFDCCENAWKRPRVYLGGGVNRISDHRIFWKKSDSESDMAEFFYGLADLENASDCVFIQYFCSD